MSRNTIRDRNMDRKQLERWLAEEESGHDEAADATREGARAVARARKEAGLTQAELAARAGTAQAVISRIERGTMSPTLDTLTRIAKGLGMRPVVAFEPLDVPRQT